MPEPAEVFANTGSFAGGVAGLVVPAILLSFGIPLDDKSLRVAKLLGILPTDRVRVSERATETAACPAVVIVIVMRWRGTYRASRTAEKKRDVGGRRQDANGLLGRVSQRSTGDGTLPKFDTIPTVP